MPTTHTTLYILAFVLGALVIFVALLAVGLWWRKRLASAGAFNLIGSIARVETPLAPEGFIMSRGELWRARRSLDRNEPIAQGELVRITGARGHLIEVKLLAERGGASFKTRA